MIAHDTLTEPLVRRLCVGLAAISMANGNNCATDLEVAHARRSAALHICMLGTVASSENWKLSRAQSTVAEGTLRGSDHLAKWYLLSLLVPVTSAQPLLLLSAIEAFASVPDHAAIILEAGLIPRLSALVPNRATSLHRYDKQEGRSFAY